MKNQYTETVDGAEALLEELIAAHGPIVRSYPSWHPLMANVEDYQHGVGYACHPGEAGYQGLDHTLYFANAFVTCPYNDGQEVVDYVKRMRQPSHGYIGATVLGKGKLYHPSTTAVLVECSVRPDTQMAVALMLANETRQWFPGALDEPWSRVDYQLTGTPSEAFLTREAKQAVRLAYNAYRLAALLPRGVL